MSIKPKIFILLFFMMASARLCADDAEYSDELENHQRNGFFGISDRPSAPQNQRNDSRQDYLNSYDPNSMANFLIPIQPQPDAQQPVLVDENFIYENAIDEYLLYGVDE
ncbi:hypothetical protein [Methylomicrobium sp. Wu6]|uniref:hypothetical protein n=1 Tax=Methylomicrobium sp. Wu6 TaxID=3107928 RepID=UPI002DD61EDD|nr:hypothetical protein [Methylomicrobium sp. Wu6]MEC4749883.1 hypothetical protein [Methylomicrobium sp. Wu6]